MSLFQTKLECPMGCSIPLCRLVDNKVWTRSLLIQAGVAVPVSLAFMYRCPSVSLVSDPRLAVCWLTDLTSRRELETSVQKFLNQYIGTSKKVLA